MALSGVVSEILNGEKCHDLEMGAKGQSKSLRVLSFDVHSDLETPVGGHSRSSKIIPFNPAPMTSF